MRLENASSAAMVRTASCVIELNVATRGWGVSAETIASSSANEVAVDDDAFD